MKRTIVRFQDSIIEGLTLDFWNTIAIDTEYITRKDERIDAVKSWFADEGFQYSTENIQKAFEEFSELWMKQWKVEHRTPGALDAVAYIILWFKAKISNEKSQELADILEDILLQKPPEPIPGAIQFLTDIAGITPIALVCDTGISGPRVIDELLKKWGIFSVIKSRVYSHDVGVSKPQPVMFRAALADLSISAARALHIGDLEETDVAGAKNIGMKVIRFDGAVREEKRRKTSKADLVANSWDEIQEALTIKHLET